MRYDDESLRFLERYLKLWDEESCMQLYNNADRKKLIVDQYELRTGLPIDIDNPKTYNEKLQWLKLYWRDERAYICADKFRSHEIVKNLGCEELCVDFIAVYDSAEEIDFAKLPNSFAMKATHCSGFNLFVRDKSLVDEDRVKRVFAAILKKHYYAAKYEWSYERIRPRIVCEPLFDVSGEEALDYKFYCFNGVVKMAHVQTVLDVKNNDDPYAVLVDRDFKPMEYSYAFPNTLTVEKPSAFEKMRDYAEHLALDFPHVRIDLYCLKGDIIKFGEFTFFPASGCDEFNPPQYNAIVGEWLDISNLEKIGYQEAK